MRSYLYAIVPEDAAPPAALRGLRGAAVSVERCGDLALWVSHLAPLEADLSDLLAHHAVVEAACAAGPALPVRFGTSFPDGGALAQALAPKVEVLRAALVRVGRKREIAITLEWRALDAESGPDTRVPADAGPGRRFMARRAAHWSALESRRARATELERRLRELLETEGVERAAVKGRIVPAPRVALSCAVLIEPGRAAEIVRRVRETGAEWADIQLHLAGPWPPYTFVDGD